MPIFIPDLFTSYINGRRQAVADNWQDLSNYNQIAAGQLNNAFNMATFDPRVRIAESQAQLGEQNTALGGAMTDQYLTQIALQNKKNIPDLSTSAQATGFNYQHALYNHNIRMLTDPHYARTYFALGLGLVTPQFSLHNKHKHNRKVEPLVKHQQVYLICLTCQQLNQIQILVTNLQPII